ncbi:hypothetical protein VTN49DRAFT_5411 [Thermomyces lanuginosus]|uniref:uncharacterized protein n=1 Tax=Thermomyces lanuginosus TaxID=5541 RepID=UPI003743EE23
MQAASAKVRQKRNRRRKSLMKKASEYSAMCGADVLLVIRMWETGKIYLFCKDKAGNFSKFVSHLKEHCYPIPIHEEFEVAARTQSQNAENSLQNA